MEWSPKAQEIFNKVIKELPQFHRTIAERLVKESAEELAELKGLAVVAEKELVEAFFKEVPPAFKPMMERLFERLNIAYSKTDNR
jgi:TRAP-type C4-dicarboxylate transport system substrate-binding protein